MIGLLRAHGGRRAVLPRTTPLHRVLRLALQPSPLPVRVPGASLAATPPPAYRTPLLTDRTPEYGEVPQLAVAEAQRLSEVMQP